MAQYKIEATSKSKNLTVSNITEVVIPNAGEHTVPTPPVLYSSPAEFASKAEADAQAEEFARWLNHEDYEGTWDWQGKATAV